MTCENAAFVTNIDLAQKCLILDGFFCYFETMKLPTDTIIGKEKVKHYLLQAKKRNDKSKWLAQAGYTVDEWQILQDDLRTQYCSAKPC